MESLIKFSISVAIGFFAIMNPIGNVPIFIGLVTNFDAKEKKVVALRSTLLAFIIVALFIIFGRSIFVFFGITLQALQISGAILIFLVGYQLLHGRNSNIHHPDKNKEEIASEPLDVSISPLAIPILAGPGTISTALSFVAASGSFLHEIIVLVVFGIVCLLTYLAFIFSDKILSYLKPGIIKVITRIMGLLLTIIAAQMMIEGITRAIK